MQAVNQPLASYVDQILITQGQIHERVAELGTEIESRHEGGDLTLLVILHGSILFAADLMRAMSVPVYLESFRVASYHGGTASSGTVSMEQAETLRHLKGQNVLLVDDILDSGRTLHAVKRLLEEEIEAATVRSCVLLDKKVTRSMDAAADFTGFEIEDAFVIGYGLDYQGKFRNLPFIGTLKPECIES
tara:strand:+ start:18901 stop:19467 length:567 start_codon:yes stop_codon:yes gene_type:complete